MIDDLVQLAILNGCDDQASCEARTWPDRDS